MLLNTISGNQALQYNQGVLNQNLNIPQGQSISLSQSQTQSPSQTPTPQIQLDLNNQYLQQFQMGGYMIPGSGSVSGYDLNQMNMIQINSQDHMLNNQNNNNENEEKKQNEQNDN